VERCSTCGQETNDPIRPFLGLDLVLCRPCFVEEDRRSESYEIEFGWFEPLLQAGFPEPIDPDAVFVRRRVKLEDLTGRRFGELEVVAMSRRWRADGRAEQVARCQCSCGAFTEIAPSQLVRENYQRCRACSSRRIARTRGGPRPTLVVGGMTLREIAALTGMSVIGVHSRVARGWPLERILAPRTRPGTRGNSKKRRNAA
jgi:hypothetical protein